MAYANYKPEIVDAKIEHELKRLCVFQEDCYMKYEGQAKELGDRVKIVGIGKPTARTLTDRYGSITAAETVEDASVWLECNTITYTNYKVSELDKMQGIKGMMNAISEESTEVIANAIDTSIAALAVDTQASKLYATDTTKADATGETGFTKVLTIVDLAVQKLYENDVSKSTEIILTCSPRFYMLMRRQYVGLDTNNSALIKNGFVGMYGNVKVKMSNNVKTSTDGTIDYMMVRTKRAIAHAMPFVKSKPYEPETGFFVDAVKAGALYGSKIIRPKEMKIINVVYA
jgi:hypothetical protein